MMMMMMMMMVVVVVVASHARKMRQRLQMYLSCRQGMYFDHHHMSGGASVDAEGASC
jgi:hypothetical protein